jgi:hypothetical protein
VTRRVKDLIRIDEDTPMAATRFQPPAPDQTLHPSGDNRFKLLEATMKKHQYRPDALIEVLHRAQELFGYLSTDLLPGCMRHCTDCRLRWHGHRSPDSGSGAGLA